MNVPISANTVVAGVDGSIASVHAVRWAARTAAHIDLPLQLVHAIPPLIDRAYPTIALYIDELRQAATEDAERFLATAVQAAHDVAPDLPVTTWHKAGDPVDVLSLASAAARLIVVGPTGETGLSELLIGSTALALPARSHCPVVVARQHPDHAEVAGGPVVVGVAGTPFDEPVIDFAFEQASRLGAGLTAVHSWSDTPLPSVDRLSGRRDGWNVIVEREQRLLAENLAGHGERYPDVPVKPIIVYDRPARALLDYAQSAQLLVVGTRGRGRFTSALLGSTSRAAMKLSPCPVAVVPPV